MRAQSSAQFEATAYHEAGHAVVAWAQGLPVRKASIVADETTHGRVAVPLKLTASELETGQGHRLKTRVEKRVRVSLAGGIAQRRFRATSYRNRHTASDHEAAVDLLGAICGSEEELQAYVHLLEIQARQLVDLYWDHIARLAAALLDRRALASAEIRRVMSS